MPLSGESNNIKYAIEPPFIDMGPPLFTKPVDKELTIINQVRATRQPPVCRTQLSLLHQLASRHQGPQSVLCMHSSPNFQRRRYRPRGAAGMAQRQASERAARRPLRAAADMLQGKGPVDFNINTSLLSRPSIVTPHPRSGVCAPGTRTQVKLKVLPGVPDR